MSEEKKEGHLIICRYDEHPDLHAMIREYDFKLKRKKERFEWLQEQTDKLNKEQDKDHTEFWKTFQAQLVDKKLLEEGYEDGITVDRKTLTVVKDPKGKNGDGIGIEIPGALIASFLKSLIDK